MELLTASENREIAKAAAIKNHNQEYDTLIETINSMAASGGTAALIGYKPDYVSVSHLHGLLNTTEPIIPNRIQEYKRKLEEMGYKITIKLHKPLNCVSFKVEW